MNKFLFFKYAQVKGYTFFLSEKTEKHTSFTPDAIAEDDNIIFASYKGRMIGAVRFSISSLPVNVFQKMGFLTDETRKMHESLLISYFFVNPENGYRSDIIISGLLLKVQEYAHKNGLQLCVGYAYNTLSQLLGNNSMSFFDINSDQVLNCSREVDNLIKESTNILLNLDRTFLCDLSAPLLKLSLGRKTAQQPQRSTRGSLSAAM